MEMTLEEYIAMYSTPSISVGEALKISLIIFLILIVLDIVICFVVKYEKQIKELLKQIEDDEDDCPNWADKQKWEKSKIERRKR